jgi:hypothetical protein
LGSPLSAGIVGPFEMAASVARCLERYIVHSQR